MPKKDTAPRNLRLDLIVPKQSRALYPDIRDSIHRYRDSCRQCYAALLTAQAAGATISASDTGVSLTPNNDRAKLVLALALDRVNVTRGAKVKGEGQQFELQVGASAGYVPAPFAPDSDVLCLG
jgi:hypothetical protein